VDSSKGNFNFFLASNKEYEEGRNDLEHHGMNLYSFFRMSNEARCSLNWEVNIISLNLYWCLGYKYIFLLFNIESKTW
jgi:hypothetical protein